MKMQRTQHSGYRTRGPRRAEEAGQMTHHRGGGYRWPRPPRHRALAAFCRSTAFLASLLVIALGCSGPRRVPDGARYPLLFFAIDGLEWTVMKPLLEAGRLPAMQRLMDAGTFGYLGSMDPTFSPVIWTSIATGKVPDKHGIRHFVYPVDDGGRREYRYYTSGHRETKAIWNILSDYGLTVHCFGWWMTYPAEPINGVMVSQTNTTGVLRNPQRALWKGTLLDGVDGQVYPPERQGRVMELLDETDRTLDVLTERIFGRRPHPMTPFSELMWDQTLWAFRADAVYIRAARDVLESGDPFDAMLVYIGGPDVSAHRFWRYAYPQEFANPPPLEQIENFGELINDYYVYVDNAIGELLDAAPEGTAVMVVSDHGMHAINRNGRFNVGDPPEKTNSAHHLDAPPGVFIATGGHMVSRQQSGAPVDLSKLPIVGGVLDVTPTLLAARGIPLGEDLDGAPMRALLDPTWLNATPLRTVATHDDGTWLKERATRIREAVDQTERLEQLRSLGYIR